MAPVIINGEGSNTVAAFEQVHKYSFFLIFQISVEKVEVSRPSLLIMRVAVGEKRGKGLFAKEKKKEPDP